MISIGFWTLLTKETRRFLKVPGQTLAAPALTTLLYFLVFGFSMGGQLRPIHGIPYVRFIVPGLVMMPLISNGFLNTASSLFMAKMQGTIVDLLVSPLAYGEILGAFVLAALLRSLMVGTLVYVIAGLFTSFEVVHPAWVLAFAVMTTVAFAFLGMIMAIGSEKFEQLNIIPTFVITPLSFLGGVFYSIERLPPPWRMLARFNPILYMVEGLRYGFIGASDVSPWAGLALVSALAAVGSLVTYGMLRTGYRLRGKVLDYFPAHAADQAEVEPIYEEMDGWSESTAGARSFRDLNANAVKYVRRIEELIGAPVALLSTSPERDDTIMMHDPFRS